MGSKDDTTFQYVNALRAIWAPPSHVAASKMVIELWRRAAESFLWEKAFGGRGVQLQLDGTATDTDATLPDTGVDKILWSNCKSTRVYTCVRPSRSV